MRSPWLDTSCVVRYLVGEPAEMAERAAAIIDSDQELILSELVLIETAYMLESFYEIPREALVGALASLVQRRNLRLLHVEKPLALEALQLCRRSNRASFVDAFLWAEARQLGSRGIVSFDRRFPSDGLEILSSPEALES